MQHRYIFLLFGTLGQAQADSEARFKPQGVKVVADLAKAEVRAYAIHMIYVPEGPYFLGSGGVEHGGFFKYTDGAQRIESYQVTSAGAIATGKQNGKLWARTQGGQLKDGGQIPASFPNGFAAFYAMNHQITATQYAAFLNSLTKEQAEKRYAGNENWDEVSKPSDLGVNKDHYSGGQGQVTRNDETNITVTAQPSEVVFESGSGGNCPVVR